MPCVNSLGLAKGSEFRNLIFNALCVDDARPSVCDVVSEVIPWTDFSGIQYKKHKQVLSMIVL